MPPKVDTNEDDCKKWTGRALGGGRAGEFAQTRFQRIPKSHLNKQTVAGVRDMNLGKVRNGEPVGAPTIRFDTGIGKHTNTNPHINIDPKGKPSSSNPHVEVPPGVIKGAEVANKVIKYGGIALTVAAVAVDSWRVYNAFKDDIYIRDNATKIIQELENAIKELNSLLKTEGNTGKRREIKATIEHFENVLKDVRRIKKLNVPVKTVKTLSSVGGGWSGGFAGGSAGAWAGAQGGAAMGALFGPVGAVVGAPVGAVLGAIGGGVGGGMLGSYAGETAAEVGLDIAESLS